MKKLSWLTVLAALVMAFGSIGIARAEIIPPFGEGQIGLQAVVLCEKLSMRREPGASSKLVQTLHYGDRINVTNQADGWARAVIGDSEDAPYGWVNADYIVIDPAWYRTEKNTPVYAWNSTAAPKVALLDANTDYMDPGTFLPILKNEGEWILVSLRGAVGWIHLK